uniref:Uncharacterized protein n=1 Tax=Aegilops tauschii subsp. strangulata TaxID=200361 RepID=A0A453C992_AEGTS
PNRCLAGNLLKSPSNSSTPSPTPNPPPRTTNSVTSDVLFAPRRRLRLRRFPPLRRIRLPDSPVLTSTSPGTAQAPSHA